MASRDQAQWLSFIHQGMIKTQREKHTQKHLPVRSTMVANIPDTAIC